MKYSLTTNNLVIIRARDYIVDSHLPEVADFVLASRVPLCSIALCRGFLVRMRVGGFIDECDLWMFCGASPTIKSDGVTRFVVANRRNGRMFWA